MTTNPLCSNSLKNKIAVFSEQYILETATVQTDIDDKALNIKEIDFYIHNFESKQFFILQKEINRFFTSNCFLYNKGETIFVIKDDVFANIFDESKNYNIPTPVFFNSSESRNLYKHTQIIQEEILNIISILNKKDSNKEETIPESLPIFICYPKLKNDLEFFIHNKMLLWDKKTRTFTLTKRITASIFARYLDSICNAKSAKWDVVETTFNVQNMKQSLQYGNKYNDNQFMNLKKDIELFFLKKK